MFEGTFLGGGRGGGGEWRETTYRDILQNNKKCQVLLHKNGSEFLSRRAVHRLVVQD